MIYGMNHGSTIVFESKSRKQSRNTKGQCGSVLHYIRNPHAPKSRTMHAELHKK